jgi:NADH dehydrogenase FAD-containing subunit
LDVVARLDPAIQYSGGGCGRLDSHFSGLPDAKTLFLCLLQSHFRRPACPVIGGHAFRRWAMGEQAFGSVHIDQTYDVVVLGAGYAGLMAALRMARRSSRLRIALVSAREHFVERVRLQEGIVAEVPLRLPSITGFLRDTPIDFVRGSVLAVEADQRRVRIATDGGERQLTFHRAVYALGSDIDVAAVPGADMHAYRLSTRDGVRSGEAFRAKLRGNANRSLRVVVVGGAETGVEVAGEIKTNWPGMDVALISRGRCGSFRGARVEQAVRAALGRLGVRLVDNEAVTEVRATEIITASGRSVACDVCVWAGGLRASPVAREAGIATDQKGRIKVDGHLQSLSHPHVLAVGDAASPVVPTGAPYRPSAFAALISGAHAADVILADKSGRQLPPFSFSTFGQGIAIGHGGVGFFSYPDDRQRGPIIAGRTARHIRNFFVWLVSSVLKAERRFPGFFFWPGRKRVSWQQADGAIADLHATGGTVVAAGKQG